MPSRSAPARANGLNAEPGCTRAWVASLRPPAVATAVHRDDRARCRARTGGQSDVHVAWRCSSGRSWRTARTAARCDRLSNVVITLQATEVDVLRR